MRNSSSVYVVTKMKGDKEFPIIWDVTYQEALRYAEQGHMWYNYHMKVYNPDGSLNCEYEEE